MNDTLEQPQLPLRYDSKGRYDARQTREVRTRVTRLFVNNPYICYTPEDVAECIGWRECRIQSAILALRQEKAGGFYCIDSGYLDEMKQFTAALNSNLPLERHVPMLTYRPYAPRTFVYRLRPGMTAKEAMRRQSNPHKTPQERLESILTEVGVKFVKRPDGRQIIIGRQYPDGLVTVALDFNEKGVLAV